MASSLQEQLNNAIKANSAKLVQLALDAGARSSGAQIQGESPLEKAVVNVYDNWYGEKKAAASLAVVDQLLAAGVRDEDRAAAVRRATHLASKSVLDRVEVLENAIRKILASEVPPGFANVPKTPVARSTFNTWKSLLFSQKYSDVQFVFPDGSSLHAHRNVLAAASPYFDKFFNGPWGHQNSNGVWETTNSVPVMKAVLTFVYVGMLDKTVLETNWAEMLSVTDQYELQDLQALTEQVCIEGLNLRTVKSRLQAAHLHNSKRLKQACFDFIRRKAARVLADPKIMSLQDEDPDLWSELAAAMKQGG